MASPLLGEVNRQAKLTANRSLPIQISDMQGETMHYENASHIQCQPLKSSLWLAIGISLASTISVANEQEIVCRYCEGAHERLPFGFELEGTGRRYAPDRAVDILHIKIDVTPDFKRRTVQGTTSITFAPISKPLKSLRLDAIHLTIRSVTSGETIDDFVSTSKDLTIVFKDPIPVGKKAVVAVDHVAEPTQGLYFRTPEMGYPETDTHLWTQGETHEARHWFPCFDYPNERSSTEIICRVPVDMTVLSNGERLGESIDPKTKLKAVHWLQAQPHVNYLICLVAGHLKKFEKRHRNIALGFYTQPSLYEQAANSFEDTEKIMEFFEMEIGVPFPWVKYDQVTIRDFVAGGMENTTLTTLYHRTIFSQETENLHTTRRLDAHEMAHQWFGDYVTCKDWSHLWLNEGFATFYTHLYEGHKFGNDAMLYGLFSDARNRVLTDRKNPKPIVYNQYSNPMEQFDYRAYPKGSWVLHMLRSQLGPDLYRKCIQTYLEQHALTSVVSEDLRKVVERMSGRTFDRFFDQWVYHARHPDLKIRHKWDAELKIAQVTVEQTQKVDNQVLLFEFPTKLRFVVNGQNYDREIWINEKQHEFFVALPAQPEIVRFDPDFTVLANVDFKKSDDQLFAQIKNADDTMGRILAAEQLATRKTQQSVEHLEAALKNDPFFGVRIESAKALQKIDNDHSFDALAASQEQKDARVRIEVVKAIAGTHRDETLEILRAVAKNEKNPGIKAEAIKPLGRYPIPQVSEMILEALHTKTFRDELTHAAVQAIRHSRSATFVEPLIETIKNRIDHFDSRSVRPVLAALALIASNENDKTEVRDVLIGFLTSPKASVRLAAMRALGELRDPGAAAVVESFIKDGSTSPFTKAAQESAKKLNEVKVLAPQEIIELRELALELKKQNEKLQKDMDALKEKLKAKSDTE